MRDWHTDDRDYCEAPAPVDIGAFRTDRPRAAGRVELEVVSAASFAGLEVPTRPWLVRDWIPDRTVTMLSGDGGTGKSLLAVQLGIAVATGTDWLGTLPEAGPTVYLSAEDEIDEAHRRLSDILGARGLVFEQTGAFHLIPLAGRDAVLGVSGRSGLVEGTPVWAALVEKVRAIRPKLLVVDNLADAFSGNENNRPEVRQFIGLLRSVAIDLELAVLLIAHPSLTGIASGTGLSGSTAWNASVRSRLYFERAKSGDGDEPDPDLRILRLVKSNYSPSGAEIRMRWQAGRFALDGLGFSGFDRVAAEAKADALFLDLLRQFESQGRSVSPSPSVTFAPTVFAAHPDAAGFTSKAFGAAMNRLFKADAIRVEKFGPPSKQRMKIVVAA